MSGGPDAAAARRRIEERLAELRRLSEAGRAARETVTLDQTSVGRLSRMDAMQQKAMADAEEARRQVEIRRLEGALRLLDEGEYGWCASCGEEIAPARLEVDPAATLCVRCAERAQGA